MSGPVYVRGSVYVPETELTWRFSRSSGPGGQHVNTTDSQVELRFDLARSEALPPAWKERALERLGGRLSGGVLSVRSSKYRSQWRNRENALARLSSILQEATAPAPRPRKPTKPTRAMVERRLEKKRRRSEIKRQRSFRYEF